MAFSASVVGFADGEIRVTLAQDAGYPPTLQVMSYCTSADGTEAVQFADVFKSYYGLGHDDNYEF